MAQEQVPEVGAAPEIVATDRDLKYLGFIPSVFVKITAYIASLYELAKDSSGPLKPGVYSVEGTVKTVVGPVCQKIEGKPQDVLVFVDGKIHVAVIFLDGILPSKLKEIGIQAYDAGKTCVAEVHKDGIYTTAKGYFDKYEPLAETYGFQACKKALTVPLVPETVAFARFGAVKVNQVIVVLKDKGIPFSSYLPLLSVSYIDRMLETEKT